MQFQYFTAFLSICLNKRPRLLYAKVCIDIAVSVRIFAVGSCFFNRLLYILLAIVMLDSIEVVTFCCDTLQVCCIGSVEYLLSVREEYPPTEIWHIVVQLYGRYLERSIIVYFTYLQYIYILDTRQLL